MSEQEKETTEINSPSIRSNTNEVPDALVAQIREALGLPVKPEDYSNTQDLFNEHEELEHPSFVDEVGSARNTLQGLLAEIDEEEGFINPNLAMDLINIKDEIEKELNKIKAKFINSKKVTPPSIASVLDLDLRSKEQIPHALLAISLLYGTASEDQIAFFDKINKIQFRHSSRYIDKMHISIHSSSRSKKRKLFISVIENFINVPNEDSVEYLVQD